MLRVEIRDGFPVRLVNRLAGETLAADNPLPLVGIRHQAHGELWNNRAQSEQHATPQGLDALLVWQAQSGVHRLTTRWQTLPEGDVLITQHAESERGGLVGMQWGIAIPQGWQLLLPVMGGFRLTPEVDFEPLRLEYPYPWEAQFVLVQGRRGGFLVYAEDDMNYFKRLFVRRQEAQVAVGFESWNHAPFSEIQRADSVCWRIRAYRGNWLHGAAMYRRWAEERFGLARCCGLKPGWVGDIQTFVIDNLDDMERLEALAQRFVPRQTMIYVPAWRARGYDRYYPDYTPRENFAEQVHRAQQMGFRVMLHVNYFGCHPEHPDYEELRSYHHLDPFTREPVYWEWRGQEPPVKFAYINPASSAWRELFVERMAKLCRQLRPDALHLDQSAVIFNDGNGTVDGMNAMQGNIALHRELLEALPEVALSGEGLSEVSCRYESFAQRHVWGLDSVFARLVPHHIAAAHPVSSALFTPYTRLYGYLGMVNPFSWRLYAAWRTAYDCFGVIPTFAWLEKEQLIQPDAVMRALIQEANWFAQHRPQPCFSPDEWRRGTLFMFRTAQGTLARVYRDVNGVCLQIRTGQGWTVVSRRIEGVTRTRVGGHIPGWLAYREREAFGLNPAGCYPWSPESPGRNRLHIRTLPDRLRLAAAAVQAGAWAYFSFESQSTPVGSEVELFSPQPPLQAYLDGAPVGWTSVVPNRYRFSLPAHRGNLVLLFERPAPLSLPASLDVKSSPAYLETDRIIEQPIEYRHGMLPTVTPEGTARLGLFAHPLPEGRVFHAVLVRLPLHGSWLRGTVTSRLNQTSLRLSVEVNGRETWNQTLTSTGEQAWFEIPLDEWKGQTVLLRFIAQSPANYHLHPAEWSDVRIG